MDIQSPQTRPPKPRLRWYQYTLRSLLGLTVLVSILASWCAVRVRRFERQEEAVAALRELGAKVMYYRQVRKIPRTPGAFSEPLYPGGEGPPWLTKLAGKDCFAKVLSVDLGRAKIADGDLEYLTRLPGLRKAILHDTPITDAGLVHVAELVDLEELDLRGNKDLVDGVMVAGSGMQITGAGLARLGRLGNLQKLVLSETDVTDAGLEYLTGLARLRDLHLGGTLITDAGLARLGGLRGLESLTLNYTQVTDAGLEHLKDLVNLKTLHLANTQVTDRGLESLKSMRRLTWLSLQQTQVVGQGLVHLKEASGLERLFLGFNRNLTDAALPHVGALPNLEMLSLERTSITDAGLVHLQSLTKLQSLRLDYNRERITPQAVESLQKALPSCQISR